MEALIRKKVEQWGLIYIPLAESSIERVAGLLLEGHLFEPREPLEYLYLSVYYDWMIKDPSRGEKILGEGALEGCLECRANLAFRRVRENRLVDESLQSLDVLAERGHSRSLIMLANYHQKANSPLVVKYAKMLLKDEITRAKGYEMLTEYYQARKDYPTMIGYYEQAIEHGYLNCQEKLGIHYLEFEDTVELGLYHLTMAEEQGSSLARVHLVKYYWDEKEDELCQKYCEKQLAQPILALDEVDDCRAVAHYYMYLLTSSASEEEYVQHYHLQQAHEWNPEHEVIYSVLKKWYQTRPSIEALAFGVDYGLKSIVEDCLKTLDITPEWLAISTSIPARMLTIDQLNYKIEWIQNLISHVYQGPTYFSRLEDDHPILDHIRAYLIGY